MPWSQHPAVSDCSELVLAVGEIYAAAENPALWPTVLERIANLVEGENVVLVANYADAVADDIQSMARSDPEMWKPYREHYASVNVWTEHCDRMFPPGTVRYSHQAIPDAKLQKTEFYSDFLKPNGMAYGFGIEIALPDQPKALLSALRSPQRGPFQEKQGRFLEVLLPHLQRSLRLHFEVTILRSTNHGLELALDAFDRAVFGLNVKGKVLFSNRAARQLLAESDGLIVRNHRLMAAEPAQDAEFQFLLEQAARAGSGFSSTGAALIGRKSGKPSLRLTFMPFAGNLLGYIPELTTLVFVDDPAKKPRSRAATLRSLFRLSPAEARLADLLAQGLDVREVSEHLGITLETTRFHLKRILAKTGTRRQTELMRLTLSLPGT